MLAWNEWKRLFAKVHIPEDPKGCWEWQAAKLMSGYGAYRIKGHRHNVAHRYTYELFKGAIPKGLEMDHLCRNRLCVNPDHLEAVTRQENLRRGISANREKTRCPQGHEFNSKNTRFGKNAKGHQVRHCRVCHNDGTKRFRDRLRNEDPLAWKAQYRRWYESRKAKALKREDF